jgi:uncharacterized protein YbaR (Trm112 family)
MINLNLLVEVCCDTCGEPMHYHIDCPECKTRTAPTDWYSDHTDADTGAILSCEQCGSQYRLVDKSDGCTDSWLFELVATRK